MGYWYRVMGLFVVCKGYVWVSHKRGHRLIKAQFCVVKELAAACPAREHPYATLHGNDGTARASSPTAGCLAMVCSWLELNLPLHSHEPDAATTGDIVHGVTPAYDPVSPMQILFPAGSCFKVTELLSQMGDETEIRKYNAARQRLAEMCQEPGYLPAAIAEMQEVQ